MSALSPPSGSTASRWISRFYVPAVAVVFLAAVYVRSTLPLPPFADPDTMGYLYPSLSRLAGGPFMHIYGRSFPYPLFLYWVQKLFVRTESIALVQHLIGLASGGLLLLAWRRFTVLHPLSTKAEEAHMVLGVAMLAAFLLACGTVRMEHTIRPESLFAFFTILAVGLATEYCIAFYRKRNLKTAFVIGTALSYTSALIYFLKPAWGLATLFASAPVVVSVFQARRTVVYGIGVLLVPALLAVVTLWISEQKLIRKYDPYAALFLPGSLFVYHAPEMRNEIAAELAGGGRLPCDPEFLRTIVRAIDEELQAKHESHYPTLGYDPEVLMGGKSVYGMLQNRFPSDLGASAGFCWHYYLGAWRHQPGAMLRSLGRQMKTFIVDSIHFKGPFESRTSNRIRIGESARSTLTSIPAAIVPGRLAPIESYLHFWKAKQDSSRIWKQWVLISAVHSLFRVLYSPALYATVLLTLGIALSGRAQALAGTVQPGSLWFALYLFSLNFWNTLSIALTVSTEIHRYLLSQLGIALLAEGWALLMLLEFSSAYWRRRCAIAGNAGK